MSSWPGGSGWICSTVLSINGTITSGTPSPLRSICKMGSESRAASIVTRVASSSETGPPALRYARTRAGRSEKPPAATGGGFPGAGQAEAGAAVTTTVGAWDGVGDLGRERGGHGGLDGVCGWNGREQRARRRQNQRNEQTYVSLRLSGHY